MTDDQGELMPNPDRDIGTWTRTCQECGTKVKKFKEPKQGQATDAYLNAKCPHCKSEGSLDYGSLVFKREWQGEE